MKTTVFVDRGSTDDYGVESIAAMLPAGPYRWRAHDLRALGVATNRMTFGAYRAPTAPPAAFALESLIDEVADRLNIDPLELRLRNVAGEGDRSPAGRPFPVFGAKHCLERLRDHPLYARRNALPADEGIGIALGWWAGGYEPAAALCRLDKDGHLTVITGAADMTGVETSFAAIAADAFGVDPSRVRVVNADTASAPYAGTSGGSKITYAVGRAVQRAAIEARERLLEIAAEELEIAPEDLEIVGGQIQPAGVPAKAIAVAELADKILCFGSMYPPVEGHGRVAFTGAAGRRAPLTRPARSRDGLGDPAAPRRRLGRRPGAQPPLVEGQMMGGTAQGLGWALLEELVHDEHGQLPTGTFVDYALPTSGFTPVIETMIVEVPVPDGPYGAKGVGEAPVVAAPAAVANAVAAAAGGVRMRRLPMTPERVWTALGNSNGSRP